MVRLQSLLKRRLSRHLPDSIRLVSALVVDYVHPSCAEELRELSTQYDYWVCCDPPADDDTFGIRRPTTRAIVDAADAVKADHILRINQDAYVIDASVFAADVASIIGGTVPFEWIAAAIESQEVNDHSYWNPYLSFCNAMGLSVPARIVFPQGAVVLASRDVWRKYYLGLAKDVHHFFEDVLMGQWLLQSGGSLVPMRPTWRHQHNCSAILSEWMFNELMRELSADCS